LAYVFTTILITYIKGGTPAQIFLEKGSAMTRATFVIFFTEVIKFYWLMLLYPGELYRLLGASSLSFIGETYCFCTVVCRHNSYRPLLNELLPFLTCFIKMNFGEDIFSSPGQKPMWAIAITCRLLSSICKLFQKSSSLKPLNQTWPQSSSGCLL
jgi:hypothetical protein